MIAIDTIFAITTAKDFEKIALKIFRYQYENNLVYRQFCDLLQTDIRQVKKISQIPFLPIQFFKTHKIVSNTNAVQQIFTSSGTTGSSNSQHFVTDLDWYERSYRQGFSQFYGNIEDYVVLALLPSYQERQGSSLIYMIDDLIQKTNNINSGYYLNNHQDLLNKINYLKDQNILLIGVTYALLDFIEYLNTQAIKLQHYNIIIMETGGMKGRRKEMIRDELHHILQTGFGVNSIHSEYGMTELLSQAYSLGNGFFECPNWMQVQIRDTQDALTYKSNGKTGCINIIDLANVNSCSFIATQDLGRKHINGAFEVLGRFDNSDIRGCNLMIE